MLVFTMLSGVFTVMLSEVVWLSVEATAASLESVTLTMNAEVVAAPVSATFPLLQVTVPAAPVQAMPVGGAPELTEDVYGGNPPVAWKIRSVSAGEP
jgi:hypothetical protein